MAALTRGQRIRLSEVAPGSPVQVQVQLGGLAAAEIRVFALLLDGQDAATGVAGSSGPVTAAEGEARADFRLDPAAMSGKVLIVASMTEAARAAGRHLGMVKSCTATIGSASFSLVGSDIGRECALILLEIYLKGEWRVSASGTGFVGGLPSMMSQYKAQAGMWKHLEGSRGGGGALPPPAINQGGGNQGGANPGISLARPPGGAPALSGAPGRPAMPVPLPAGWPGGQAPPSPHELLPAVGRIAVTLKDKEASGTGFVVSPGGFLITCHHVIDEAVRLSFQPADGSPERPLVVLASNPQIDIALCWLADGAGSCVWLPIAPEADPPRMGTEIGLLGYPYASALGTEITYTQGIVNSVRGQVLQIDAGAAPGSSGGPVFRRGPREVIGVLGGGLPNHPGGMLINFASDIRAIWRQGWVRAWG